MPSKKEATKKSNQAKVVAKKTKKKTSTPKGVKSGKPPKAVKPKVKKAAAKVVKKTKPKVVPPVITKVKPAPVPIQPITPPAEKIIVKKELVVPPKPKISFSETVTVKELAEKMRVGVADLIKKLMALGVLATINQRLDKDTVALVAAEYGFEAQLIPLYGEEMIEAGEESPADLKPRSPVVTIMGHVDHGKTSLLDAIRQSRVAEKEAGGITQHIGAYKVETERGSVVFLDTPGHEAFSAMRARGAQVTDIVVLVVAADDGVMPQTIEAVDHARAAGVPIIVAINKIDLPQANPQRIKQELSGYNLVAEEWGGQTIFVEISAKNKINIDKLLEMIILQAELLELRANPRTTARGVVVEARLDPQRGPVATVLVEKGTLHLGEAFVCGSTAGKIRAIIDDRMRRLKEAGPATPVEILGYSSLPNSGDSFIVVKDERSARHIAERRAEIFREDKLTHRHHLSLEDVHKQIVEGKLKELKIILKADVWGSVEALRDSLEKLSTPEVKLTVIHSGVGGVKEADVILAVASDALIIGFNVRPEMGVEALSQREGVSIKTYRIIYEVVSDIRAAMEGLLEPLEKEVTLGRAEVRDIFRVPKIGIIAGCYVIEGKIQRGVFVRVLRNNTIVYEGKNSSLKRFKDDVREVEKGFECGIGVENFQDIKKGDVLEFYIQEKVARKLTA